MYNENNNRKDLERLIYSKVIIIFYSFCVTYWLMDFLKFI